MQSVDSQTETKHVNDYSLDRLGCCGYYLKIVQVQEIQVVMITVR